MKTTSVPLHRVRADRAVQIIDLDGCIADDRGRRKHIKMHSHPDPFEWFRMYHQGAWADSAFNTEEVQRLNGTRIIVNTSRPVVYERITRDWLAKHNIFPFAIMMRNTFDHRPSVEVKRSAVQWMLDYYDVAKHEVVDAIDDREDVVRMYSHDFSFPARIVRIGDEEGL